MTPHPILEDMEDAAIRILIAKAAGFLAWRDGDGGVKVAQMLRRVADRLVRVL